MSADESSGFKLSEHMDDLLYTLTQYYVRKNEPAIVNLLANCSCKVDERYELRRNQGNENIIPTAFPITNVTRHTIHLRVPWAICFEIRRKRPDVADELRDRLNDLFPVEGEYIAKVTLSALTEPAPENWREAIATLPTGEIILDEKLREIWTEPEHLRLFISHKSDRQELAAKLKKALAPYEVSCFAANASIKTHAEWLEDINTALFSTHALVSLLTTGFYSSPWTNQEVGVALGRRIPVISVKVDEDPPAFTEKRQALPGKGLDAKALASKIHDQLLTMPAFVKRLKKRP